MIETRDPADLMFLLGFSGKIEFFKIRAPGSRGIALKVPEMDSPRDSAYSRAQELPLTPSCAKVTMVFVKSRPKPIISLRDLYMETLRIWSHSESNPENRGPNMSDPFSRRWGGMRKIALVSP